jgi:hypothetical protein
MNSEIGSTSVTAVPADDGPLAGTTVDPWMRQQDQLNSGDVVLGSGEPDGSQPGIPPSLAPYDWALQRAA